MSTALYLLATVGGLTIIVAGYFYVLANWHNPLTGRVLSGYQMNIRDLLWLMLLCGAIVAWRLDYLRLTKTQNDLHWERVHSDQYRDALTEANQELKKHEWFWSGKP